MSTVVPGYVLKVIRCMAWALIPETILVNELPLDWNNYRYLLNRMA